MKALAEPQAVHLTWQIITAKHLSCQAFFPKSFVTMQMHVSLPPPATRAFLCCGISLPKFQPQAAKPAAQNLLTGKQVLPVN